MAKIVNGWKPWTSSTESSTLDVLFLNRSIRTSTENWIDGSKEKWTANVRWVKSKLYAFSIYNAKSKYSVIFNLIWFSILRFISMPPSILQQSVSPPAFTYSKSIMKTSEQFWKLHKVNKKNTRTNDVILLFLLSTLNRSHPLFWSFHWFGQVNANWKTLIWKSN